MGCRPFYTVPMIDTTLSGFMINIEILQVIVEIDGTSTEVSTEERCVCCEDRRHVYLSFTAKRDGHASLPLVKMSNDSLRQKKRASILRERREVCELKDRPKYAI